MNFEAFKDAPWFDDSFRVVIGGLGNIGSWTALLLARMGYTLYLYDFDKVEHRNVGSQFYGPNDVGMKKGEAMKKHINDISGNRRVNLFEKYDDNSLVDNIMISCFDNMAGRKAMFHKWLAFQKQKYANKLDGEVNMFIDGRTLAESGEVFAVKSHQDAIEYEKTLFDDDDPEVGEQVCSYKSTSHNGSMIASMITTVLANHIANKRNPNAPMKREVPFKIDYHLEITNFRDVYL